MHLNRLGTFTLGVIVAAASIGLVSFANAASDATLKACANKSTGVMRYISKGSCNKKTEKSLSWNQLGPQGQPGITGAAGAKGETGAAGTNGRNFHVVDAAGRDFGPALSATNIEASIMYEGGIWRLKNSPLLEDRIQGEFSNANLFSDSSCTTPLWVAPENASFAIPSARGFTTTSGANKYFKPTGTPYQITTQIYGTYGPIVNGTRTCVASSNPTYSDNFGPVNEMYFTAVTEVSLPYTPPFTIVAK